MTTPPVVLVAVAVLLGALAIGSPGLGAAAAARARLSEPAPSVAAPEPSRRGRAERAPWPGAPIAARLAARLGSRLAARLGFRRRLPDRAEAWAEVAERLARASRSGRSLHQAVADLGAAAVPASVGAPLEALRAHLDAGVGFAAAATAWADASEGDEAVLASALAVAAQLGGSPGRALDTAAAALRDRHAMRAEAAAHAAPARLSLAILAALPVAVLAWSALSRPDSITVLLGQPLGWVVLGLGMALDGVGAWWMHRLVVAASEGAAP